MAFGNLTPEERAANLEKARVARAAASASRKASTLRTDFEDSEYWEGLARDRKLRLPPWGKAATVSNLRSYLRKVGVSQAEYQEELGCTLGKYIANNDGWPLRALCGVALEYAAEGQIPANVDRR